MPGHARAARKQHAEDKNLANFTTLNLFLKIPSTDIDRPRVATRESRAQGLPQR